MSDKISLTSLLALWGAFLSTILAVIESLRFYYEGVRVKVEVRGGFKVFPENTIYGDKEYIIISASNAGRRPTKITHAWLITKTKTCILASDCFYRQGGQKLDDGDYGQWLIEESDVQKTYNLKPRDYIAIVSDAVGRKFYSCNFFVRWFKIMRMRSSAH